MLPFLLGVIYQDTKEPLVRLSSHMQRMRRGYYRIDSSGVLILSTRDRGNPILIMRPKGTPELKVRFGKSGKFLDQTKTENG